MGMVISLAEARPRLRPEPKRQEIVAVDPLIEAVIQKRDAWAAVMSVALAAWGLELRPRSGRDGR